MPTTTPHPVREGYLMPSLERATVADAMHPGVVSCDADTELSAVAQLMATHRVHCIAIMGTEHDDPQHERLWGVIADIDLMRAGLRTGLQRIAGSLAAQPAITVQPATPLREAGELMLQHGTSHAVVVEPDTDRPVGILSTLDIAGVLAWGRD